MTLLLIAIAALLFFILDLSYGSVAIPPGEIMIVLQGRDISNPVWQDIILSLRLPRAITAVLAGSALSVSGLFMQTLFRNPLAGPYVLGINSGASLGVALVMMAAGSGGFSFTLAGGFFGDFGVAAAASAGAAAVMGLVLLAARRVTSNTVLLVMGIMFGYAVSSLVSVLMHFSLAEKVQSFLSWSFGSFSTATAGELAVMTPVILIGLAVSFILSKQMNALVMGDVYASSMGLNIDRVRPMVLSVAAVLAGTVTAFCGPVAFLGIAVPHLARNLVRTGDHRILVPGCILSGAAMALAADIAVNLGGSGSSLPLNAVTSIIGAPVVIWVIVRYQHVSG